MIQVDQLLGWSADAHKRITKEVISALPKPLKKYYESRRKEIVNASIMPDKRRYVDGQEGPYHYINWEAYEQLKIADWEFFWHTATPAKRKAYGALPWRILKQAEQLVWAMKSHDDSAIKRLSGDLLHYIADLHVVLHTTQYYDGRDLSETGIHRFWEKTLPLYFSDSYFFKIPPLKEIKDLYPLVWSSMHQPHLLLKPLFDAYEKANNRCPPSKRYSWRACHNRWEQIESLAYAEAFHQALDGMVYQQMHAAIYCSAQIIYSCWLLAGKPAIENLKTD